MADSKEIKRLMAERGKEIKRQRQETKERVNQLHKQGLSNTIIAKRLGISRTKVRSMIREDEYET